MLGDPTNQQVAWKFTPVFWAVLAAVAAVVAAIFYDGLALMVVWWERPEYSFGYLIPFVAAFLIWQKKNDLAVADFTGSWSGVFVVLLGAALYFAGELSSVYTIIQYSFLVVLYGVMLSFMGWRSFRGILVPLLILMFMIPLPNFIYNNLSSSLQLISSQIGVAFIRLFGISVYLEGNVIDLGTYKLQVVEACSGLRYLFPLMTLGFITAYFFNAVFWKRALIFLSSIPLTVLMNSFRIGAIGVMVEYWGQSMAEGFLHDFEGWAVFMACTVMLVLEMTLLARIGKDRRPLNVVFGIVFPEPMPAGMAVVPRKLPSQLYVASGVLAIALAASTQLASRVEIIPDRATFAEFPVRIGEWSGNQQRMDQIIVDALKFDDYLLTDYTSKQGAPVNLYIAYYGSQRKGESVHSPRSCIPGDGWRIESLDQVNIKGTGISGVPLTVNRVLIRKGNLAQVVYYWFQGRHRIITNEYMVKWYLFWDSLTKRRTDGALVRVTTSIAAGEDIFTADHQLQSFIRDVAGLLPGYIPD